MGKRKPTPESFKRGFGKAGWVYVARNNMHRDDVFKVGYTLGTPEDRVKSLNTEQRNRTSQIGFFSLHFACAVLDAQGSEQELFRRLGRLLEHERKEFVNAPLEVVVGELLHIQKKDNEAVRSTGICLHCTDLLQFCPLPLVKQQCPNCGNWFSTGQDFSPTWVFDSSLRCKSYKLKPVESTARSPLAEALIRLKIAVKHYAHEGLWTSEEFLSEVKGLLETPTPLDRETPDAKASQIKSHPPDMRTSAPPKSRSGWMDCPDCLSSIRLKPGEQCECTECGWLMAAENVLQQKPKRTSSILLNTYGRLALGRAQNLDQ